MTEVAVVNGEYYRMMNHIKSLAEDLILVPCWISCVVWVLGNLFIWLIIPVYLAVSRPGGFQDGMLASDYARVQPLISRIFNIGMAIYFAVTRGYSFTLKKRIGS
jgi:hypothetical protein